MAIVRTYQYPGCTVHIDDSAYAGVSVEELDRRAEHARRVAWGIIFAAEAREQAKAEAEKEKFKEVV
ncbi:hypothetical protein SDC9_108172 [bioreactor metagenome]|uniref:Uncharacterized protein n=1 Tax=bioreactor metagenome TaxID=1076179 RepID=A0A645BHU5_9ZZZZ